MKKIMFLFVVLFIQNAFAQQVSFTILEDKTKKADYDEIILSVELKNNSKKEIVILKPATKYRQKNRFYRVNMECEDVPVWFASASDEPLKPYEESDLLVIPAKSVVNFEIEGMLNGNIACSSNEFTLKLHYDVTEILKKIDGADFTDNEKNVLKKLTPIRIESKKVMIKK